MQKDTKDISFLGYFISLMAKKSRKADQYQTEVNNDSCNLKVSQFMNKSKLIHEGI